MKEDERAALSKWRSSSVAPGFVCVCASVGRACGTARPLGGCHFTFHTMEGGEGGDGDKNQTSWHQNLQHKIRHVINLYSRSALSTGIHPGSANDQTLISELRWRRP